MTPHRILTVIFLLPLIFAQNLRKTPFFQDPVSVLNELDNNHFGNALMSAIAVHLSSNTPIDDIITLLKTLKANLEDAQGNADYRNSTDVQQCNSMLFDFSSNIDYHTKQLETEEDCKATNEGLLKRTDENYQQILEDLSQNTERYDENEQVRNKQHDSFSKKQNDYEEAVQAIDEANSLLEHLKSGSTLIQMKKKLEKVKEKLSQQHLLHTSLYNPLISSLSEIALNADQESVKNIIILLSELRDTLAESKKGLENVEKQQLEDWEKIKGDLQNEKKNLISKKSDAEDEIENYKRLIQDAEEKIDSHSSELDSNVALYNNAKGYCDGRSDEYQRMTEERKVELEILDRLAVNFNEKLGNLKDYLKNRVNLDF